jgi:hypothetical protein
MIKKKRKELDKVDYNMVSSVIAFENSAAALKEAYKIARFNRDLDAIVAISDRWSMLGRILEREEDVKLPIGFTREVEDKDEYHS